MMRKASVVMIAVLVLILATSGMVAAKTQVDAPPERVTIVDVALAVNADTGEFSTLIAALMAADDAGANLIPTLSGKGQFTVFAPTDAAFAELGLDADNIGEVPAEMLVQILTYHVAPGARLAEDVYDGERVRTISKDFIYPYLDGGIPYLADNNMDNLDAQVILPDVDLADNGVIHVINQVLLPH